MLETNCWTVSGLTSRTADRPKNGVMYLRRWLRRFTWVDGLCWMATRASQRFANSANVDDGLARYDGSFTTASRSSSLRLASARVGRSPSFFSPSTSDLRTLLVRPSTISSSRQRPTQTVRDGLPSLGLITRASKLPRWCLLLANKPPGSLTYCPWAPKVLPPTWVRNCDCAFCSRSLAFTHSPFLAEIDLHGFPRAVRKNLPPPVLLLHKLSRHLRPVLNKNRPCKATAWIGCATQ
jgi:hypothetical protein